MQAIKYLFILVLPLYLIAAENDVDEVKKEGFKFEIIKQIETTPVKNQSKTNTCWTFATNSFLETELLRMGKGKYDLSEMFVVRMIYPQKVENYVRMHGNVTFGPGSLAGDVMRVVRQYGMVPESVFTGLYVGESKHNHQELEVLLKASLDAIINNKSRKLSKAWPKAIDGILDAYLGEIPEKFFYEGKSYTPRSFAEALGINPDDYVELTSYTHHPFYTQFSVEVPDNWYFNKYYNVPLPDFMTIIEHALNNGFSVAWDGDDSEKSFNKRKGVAILPVKEWDDRTNEEQNSICESPEPEIEVTQEIRQEHFDNYLSTDDHLMHITGLAKDQNGVKYFITKNSWGTINNERDGFIYMSESYVRSKTVSIMIHKDALPGNVAKRLKIQQ